MDDDDKEESLWISSLFSEHTWGKSSTKKS